MKTLAKKVECPYCNAIGPGRGKTYNGRSMRVDNSFDIWYSEGMSHKDYKEWDAPATDYCLFCDLGQTTPEKAAKARIALEERNTAKEQYDALQRKYRF